MDREKATEILHSRRSSKDELRAALAWMLGEEPPFTSKKDKVNPFNDCKTIFCTKYREIVGVPYIFEVKDGVSLAAIIKKVEALGTDNVPETFAALMQHLPEWYRKNAFSLPVINKKFNEIVSSIKQGNEKGQSHISAGYKQKLLNDLQS